MEKLKTFMGWITSILLVGSALWYSYLTMTGQIQPTVATFIMALTYFCISEVTYWNKNKGVSIWNNIAMHAGFANVIIATLAVVSKNLWEGNLSADFTPFHIICMIISLVILIFWKLTKTHNTSFILMQVVAVIAYLPMVIRILNAKEQTESNVLWIAILVASMTAIPKVWNGYKKDKDWLSLVYIGRVIPSNLVVVYLIYAKDYAVYPFI